MLRTRCCSCGADIMNHDISADFDLLIRLRLGSVRNFDSLFWDTGLTFTLTKGVCLISARPRISTEWPQRRVATTHADAGRIRGLWPLAQNNIRHAPCNAATYKRRLANKTIPLAQFPRFGQFPGPRHPSIPEYPPRHRIPT
jgi:hypothetical protein